MIQRDYVPGMPIDFFNDANDTIRFLIETGRGIAAEALRADYLKFLARRIRDQTVGGSVFGSVEN